MSLRNALAGCALVLFANGAAVHAADTGQTAAAPPASQVLGPDDGRKFSGGAGQNRVLADIAPGQDRSFVVMKSTNAAGYVTPWPMHFHTHFDEFSYILDGVFITDMPDGSQRKTPPGWVTYAPRLHPHHFSVPSTAAVTVLAVATTDEIISFKDAWQYANDPNKLADYLATTGTFFVNDPVRAKVAGVHPANSGAIIVGPDDGRTFTAGGAQVRMLADVPPGQERSFAVMSTVFPAGYQGWPRYYSCRFDEFWYVLDGAITVDVDGRATLIPAGTAVYSPRGTPHHMSVPGGAPAKVFVVVSAGQLAAIEGADAHTKDPAQLRDFLAKSEIYLADHPGACGR